MNSYCEYLKRHSLHWERTVRFYQNLFDLETNKKLKKTIKIDLDTAKEKLEEIRSLNTNQEHSK